MDGVNVEKSVIHFNSLKELWMSLKKAHKFLRGVLSEEEKENKTREK